MADLASLDRYFEISPEFKFLHRKVTQNWIEHAVHLTFRQNIFIFPPDRSAFRNGEGEILGPFRRLIRHRPNEPVTCSPRLVCIQPTQSGANTHGTCGASASSNDQGCAKYDDLRFHHGTMVCLIGKGACRNGRPRKSCTPPAYMP